MKLIKELLSLQEKDQIDLNFEETPDESEDKPEDTPEKEPKDKKPKDEEPAPEEQKDPETIEELFSANEGDVKEYAHIDLYDAKKLEQDTVIVANGKRTKAKAGNYVVRNHDDIKKFVIVDGEDFDGQYEQVRQAEKPDAEGFILVKPVGDIEAFQYKGDPISVKNGWNEEIDIKPSEFVVRYVDEKDSGWTVPKVEFNKVFKVK